MNFNKEVRTFDQADIDKNKGMATASIFPILFILYFFSSEKSEYHRYCANQGLMLLIINIALSIVNIIMSFIPVIGAIVSLLIWLINVGTLVIMVMLMIKAYNGEAQPFPIIGNAEILK